MTALREPDLDFTSDTTGVIEIKPSGPRERALERGLDQMGDAELVAIVLGTGVVGRSVSVVAAELLDEAGGVEGLVRLSPHAIAAQPGVGMAKALRVSAGIELGRRAAERALKPKPPLRSSRDVAIYFAPMIGMLDHEEMWVVLLDGRNNLRAIRRVAQGGLHGCSVATRDVLRIAVGGGASAFVLVHNHPSGDPQPSPSDIEMTKKLQHAGDLIGVPIVDHVILCGERHTSMLDLSILED